MAGRTIVYTIDSLGLPEAIVAHSYCFELEVGEHINPALNQDGNTFEYLLKIPDMESDSVVIPAGKAKQFKNRGGKQFRPGDVIGYLAALPGQTVEMYQIED